MHAMTAGVHEGDSAGLPGPETGVPRGQVAGVQLISIDVTICTSTDNPRKGGNTGRSRA